ncbi:MULTISPECIES: 50S ribosomal protein L6 [Marinimicrobium]|jgi:large subunit ribosomal protein L6|uniref:Large ribosomal subunit protein uL6 n=2 Tax=Marinimicrobium TaxID=359337 RepID=A0A3N1NNU1_9GAMM|nr:MULTISPECIES: 50S ribosomal protein L6 [Marinimicrobium]ROQ17111.1 LSU ribosomal protein L6P [Marinimicrobium koreense]|tara:strand:- start:136 stop:669 length:534 start_codon:yes stop_codon:yes gene_type:complete
MSRVANSPVEVPSAVKVTLQGQSLSVKGGKGTLALEIHDSVEIQQEENLLKFTARDGAKQSRALAGTMRALVGSMVKGVDQGFEEKLQLVGVGYRAKASGKTVNLSVGYSQPIDYTLPEGVTAECPAQTEIVLKSADKQLLGQVASEIRALREPEPYKGKGIRYASEQVRRKEAKKK